MAHARWVAVWGTSLLMSLVADQLGQTPGLTVVRLTPDRAGERDRVWADPPTVLIIELTPDRLVEADRGLLDFIAPYRQLPIICLDAQSGAASVVSSRPLVLNSLNDLARAVEALLAQS